ncbi:MAG: hypothetical protein ACTSYD_00360 [Candidatus Heimdallarchaeaceae archaeon]
MKLVRKKIFTKLSLVGILVLFSALIRVSATQNFGIVEIAKSPSTLVSGENMIVTIDFADVTNISMVKLLVCQLSPEFKCESQPIIMENITNEELPTDIVARFRGEFLVYYENGTSVGYHIFLVYENYTTVTIPESSNFLSMEIVEPTAGEYFFFAGIVGQEEETTKTVGFGFLTVLYGSVILLKMKKRRRKN